MRAGHWQCKSASTEPWNFQTSIQERTDRQSAFSKPLAPAQSSCQDNLLTLQHITNKHQAPTLRQYKLTHKSEINTLQLATGVQISPSKEWAVCTSSIPLISFSSFDEPRVDIIPAAHHHPPHICQSNGSYVLCQPPWKLPWLAGAPVFKLTWIIMTEPC